MRGIAPSLQDRLYERCCAGRTGRRDRAEQNAVVAEGIQIKPRLSTKCACQRRGTQCLRQLGKENPARGHIFTVDRMAQPDVDCGPHHGGTADHPLAKVAAVREAVPAFHTRPTLGGKGASLCSLRLVRPARYPADTRCGCCPSSRRRQAFVCLAQNGKATWRRPATLTMPCRPCEPF